MARRRILRRVLLTVLVVVAALVGVVTVKLWPHHPDRPLVAIAPSAPLLLTGVTVVDVATGGLTPDQDVLADRGRIVSVGAAGAAKPPAGTRTVDARGKFLVPGFNDYHAHPLGPDDPSGALALMLANGITGFRQMQGSPEMLAERRDGRLPTGRYAPAALVMPGTILTPFNAGSPADAVATVREEKAQGADFVKLGLAAPAPFMAALAEANRVGLPFVGHLQANVDAAKASAAGMRAMEHLGPGDTILLSCSTDEAALRAQVAKRPPPPSLPIKVPFADRLFAAVIARAIVNPAALADPVDVGRYREIAATFSEPKCRALAATFVANRTWQVPTLVRMRSTELGELPEYANDPNNAYVPPADLQSWREATARFSKKQTAASRADFRTAYALQLRLARLFDDAGVAMMAGSDESGQWEVPGFSLHQEFDELAKAGIPPLHILQQATINGARFLGREATMGSVAAGRNADLVLLDGNPVVAAANLHRIAGVVRAGYYFSRADLDGLLAKVRAQHGVFHPGGDDGHHQG